MTNSTDDPARAREALDKLPTWCLPTVAFLASIGAQATRRPDLFLHPQFYAEDGIFFAQAHNFGLFATLFTQSNGYLQLLPRLVAAVANEFPVAWGPTLFLVCAACVDAIPAAFVVSRRMRSAIPSASARLLLATLYIAMPGTVTCATVLTYSQWHFAFLAFLVLVADAPASRGGRVADGATVALSGLSGPYSLLLAPVATAHALSRRSRRTFALALILWSTAVAQLVTILTVGRAARSTAPLGATAFRFLRIVGGRIFYGATAGEWLQGAVLPAWQSSLGNDSFIAAVGAAGLVVLVVAAALGTHELRMLLLFGAAIVGAALLSASVAADGPPQWVVLCNQSALTTYFIIPILGLYAACVWMLGQRRVALRAVGATVIALAAGYGIPKDWRADPVENLDFPAYARQYDAAQPGTIVAVPTPPRPWTIDLVKPAR